MEKERKIFLVTLASIILLLLLFAIERMLYSYPLNNIDSDEVDRFKQILLNSGEIFSENISFTISNKEVIVNELDESGKIITKHSVKGQLAPDMRDNITKKGFANSKFLYDITLTPNGDIEGYRVINQIMLDKQQNGIFKQLETQFMGKGLNDLSFSVSKDKLYYGKYTVLGKARDDAFDILYGLSYSFGNYDIVINSEDKTILTN